jgi:hypothetical protein
MSLFKMHYSNGMNELITAHRAWEIIGIRGKRQKRKQVTQDLFQPDSQCGRAMMNTTIKNPVLIAARATAGVDMDEMAGYIKTRKCIRPLNLAWI